MPVIDEWRHAAREHRLPDGVVDLVRAGVVQVLALQEDLRAAEFAAQSCRVVDRARPSDEMLQFVLKLLDERRVVLNLGIGALEFIQRMPAQRINEARNGG